MIRKVLQIAVVVLLIIIIGIHTVYAGPVQPTTNSAVNNTFTKTAKNIWSTAVVIIQILAVAAIVFAGVRYMFASADAKADIKKQTVILIIGAVFVFGAVKIAQLIYNAANTVISTT